MDTMPFGRYRGLAIDDLHDAYLRWLCTINLQPPLAHAVRAEAARRGLVAPAAVTACSMRRLAEHVIGAGVRALARQLHLDVGGSHEAMTALNHVAERLRQLARGTLQ